MEEKTKSNKLINVYKWTRVNERMNHSPINTKLAFKMRLKCVYTTLLCDVRHTSDWTKVHQKKSIYFVMETNITNFLSLSLSFSMLYLITKFKNLYQIKLAFYSHFFCIAPLIYQCLRNFEETKNKIVIICFGG